MKKLLTFVSILELMLLLAPVYSFADQQWSEIKPGTQMSGFSLYKDGSVAINRVKVFKFEQFQAVMLSFSPSGKFAIVLNWDYDKAGFGGFVVDVKSRRVISKTNETGLLNRASWSSDEKYMLLQIGGEGIGEVLCFNLQKGTVNKLLFKDMSKTYKPGLKEIQLIDLNKVTWLNSYSIKIPIELYCNHYDDQACNSEKPRSVHQATVDLRTLRVSIGR